MRTKRLLGIITGICMIIFSVAVFNSCKKEDQDEGVNMPPYYNLDVTLLQESAKLGHSEISGFIKFRQDPDTARIVTLDTWISHLQPNHEYLLQRAVNPITDASCTSTAWLTLGLGLTPQSITTNSRGEGHEQLFRALTTIARGTQFRIHFQIIDASTLTTVLTSDCYQYTVR